MTDYTSPLLFLPVPRLDGPGVLPEFPRALAPQLPFEGYRPARHRDLAPRALDEAPPRDEGRISADAVAARPYLLGCVPSTGGFVASYTWGGWGGPVPAFPWGGPSGPPGCGDWTWSRDW